MSLIRTLALNALEQVQDPEVGLDVVALGLIYGLGLEEGRLKLTMTLTSRGCPMGAVLTDLCRSAVQKAAGSRPVALDVVWEPAWNPAMISEEGRERLRS